MEYQELKNYGTVFTGKLSPRVLLAVFTSIPKELGFIGTPKFLTKIGGKEREWKGKLVKIAQPRGVTHKEFLEASEYNMAFYSALVSTLGKEKALVAYTKLSDKLAVLSYDEFLPSAKDFRSCPEYWEAVKGYFLGFFRAFEQENILQCKVLQADDQELHVHCTGCAIPDIYNEVGRGQLAAIICEGGRVSLANLCNDLGGEYRRKSKICTGDAVCDWHFLRQKAPS